MEKQNRVTSCLRISLSFSSASSTLGASTRSHRCTLIDGTHAERRRIRNAVGEDGWCSKSTIDKGLFAPPRRSKQLRLTSSLPQIAPKQLQHRRCIIRSVHAHTAAERVHPRRRHWSRIQLGL
jgi:hypothetical protein